MKNVRTLQWMCKKGKIESRKKQFQIFNLFPITFCLSLGCFSGWRWDDLLSILLSFFLHQKWIEKPNKIIYCLVEKILKFVLALLTFQLRLLIRCYPIFLLRQLITFSIFLFSSVDDSRWCQWIVCWFDFLLHLPSCKCVVVRKIFSINSLIFFEQIILFSKPQSVTFISIKSFFYHSLYFH
jgi:hypothetical protein